jgi:hypothetical protein
MIFGLHGDEFAIMLLVAFEPPQTFPCEPFNRERVEEFIATTVSPMGSVRSHPSLLTCKAQVRFFAELFTTRSVAAA